MKRAEAKAALDAMADEVAKQTADAYSWDRYGEAGWRACARMLARRGHSAREIEAVLRSKWTRWAADEASKNAGTNSADLAQTIDHLPRGRWAQEVADLVAGTF